MMKKVIMLAALLCCTLSGFAEKTHGDVLINSGNVNITANRVELQSGVKISKGATFKIDNP